MKFRLPIVLPVLALSLASAPAQAQVVSGFQDAYAPANWTFIQSGDGSVNTAAAPASITLLGKNNGWPGGNNDFVIKALGAGKVTFDWFYTTADGPSWDGFSFLKNGVATFVSNTNNQTGTSIFDVVYGDTFGFRIYSVDGCCGRAAATISKFSAPVPAPLPLLGVAAAFSYTRRLRQFSHLLSNFKVSSAS